MKKILLLSVLLFPAYIECSSSTKQNEKLLCIDARTLAQRSEIEIALIEYASKKGNNTETERNIINKEIKTQRTIQTPQL